MVLYNEKIKHLSCSDLRVFLKRLVKDKIEKEWTEDFIDNMNLVIIPRMTIKRRYENKGIDMSRLIDNPTYYQKCKNLILTCPFPQSKKLGQKYLNKSYLNQKVKMDANLTVMIVTNKLKQSNSSYFFNDDMLGWAAYENSKKRFKL